MSDDPTQAPTDEDETADEPTAKAASSQGTAVDGGAAVTDSGPDLAWLQALEERVREAASRLRELDAENDRLQARIEELEEALEEAEASTPEAPAGDGEAAPSAASRAWKEEREEIRTRVQRLTDDLESLLGEGG